jgi:hypothetical protein
LPVEKGVALAAHLEEDGCAASASIGLLNRISRKWYEKRVKRSNIQKYELYFWNLGYLCSGIVGFPKNHAAPNC